MTKITKIDNVLNLLAKEELTSKEITEKLGEDITSNIVCVYLNILLNDGRIERTNDKRPFKYKIPTKPVELLKQLYEIMDTKMKPVKPLDDNEKKVLTVIMEMI